MLYFAAGHCDLFTIAFDNYILDTYFSYNKLGVATTYVEFLIKHVFDSLSQTSINQVLLETQISYLS